MPRSARLQRGSAARGERDATETDGRCAPQPACEACPAAHRRPRQPGRGGHPAARPGIPVEHVLADYTKPLQLPRRPPGGRRLVLFLGGTIGNEEDESAIRLLSRVREHMEPDDLLLLGANLATDPAAIHLAYNDATGVTAAFNRNLLLNVNSFARSNFDPEKFDHYAPYIVEKRRIEMWLVAREETEVHLGRLAATLELARGEGIRPEISRRFTREEVLRLIDASGFTPERWIESPDGRFGLALGLARASLRGL